jgi:GT2 family glycosyltransferase
MNFYQAVTSDDAKKKVSIVVVNYNSGMLLRSCVESCLPQAEELILVDNASADVSLQLVLDEFAGVEKLKIIRNKENLGFATACNLGAKVSSGEFVLFLNPDCIATEESVNCLALALESDAKAGMAGGLLLDPTGKEQEGCRRSLPTPWRSLVRTLHLSVFEKKWPRLFSDFNLHNHPLPTTPIVIEAISGACTMVKRIAIADVGPWDEAYFLHCEDLDLCMRYRQRFWTILFVPDARFVHFQGACSKSKPVFVEWHKHKGMMRFYSNFFSHRYPRPLWIAVYLGVWLRFCLVAGLQLVRLILNKNK